jgi:hypothetical protein
VFVLIVPVPFAARSSHMRATGGYQIVLEVVATTLQLRVGSEVVTTVKMRQRSVLMLRVIAQSYSKRHGIRFLEKTKN